MSPILALRDRANSDHRGRIARTALTERAMLAEWTTLSQDLQVALSREAMRRASAMIAEQAEALAGEMETGGLPDRGGPEALRLLAAVVRLAGQDPLVPAGHC